MMAAIEIILFLLFIRVLKFKHKMKFYAISTLQTWPMMGLKSVHRFVWAGYLIRLTNLINN